MNRFRFNLWAYASIGIFNILALIGYLIVNSQIIGTLGIAGSSLAWCFAVTPKGDISK